MKVAGRNQSDTVNQLPTVISCLEHEHLTQADFVEKQDFDYLIEQELPCFHIKIIKGRIVLIVRHYLANIILPSGCHLEILAKLSVTQSNTLAQSNTLKHKMQRQQDIENARRWIKQMMRDIAHFQSKPLSAQYLEALNNRYHAKNNLDNNTNHYHGDQIAENDENDSRHNVTNEQGSFDFDIPQILAKQLANDQSLSNQSHLPDLELKYPWYQGLLKLAEQSILAAADILPNSYQREHHNSPQAKGKLNIKAQLKTNWHRPHYFYSEQTTRRVENQLVRFLATGWYQLNRYWLIKEKHHMNEHAHASLNRGQQTIQINMKTAILKTAYQGVQPLEPHQWQTAYQTLQRLQPQWQAQLTQPQAKLIAQAIAWTWWLLSQHKNTARTLTSCASSQASDLTRPRPALMVNMNHAFERWVLGKLVDYVHSKLPESRITLQPSFNWLYNDDINIDAINNDSIKKDSINTNKSDVLYHQPSVIQRLQPDACIHNAKGEITHVIDVKYKAVKNIYDISGNDWQQMYTYQQYLQSTNAWLIVPYSFTLNQPLQVVSAQKVGHSTICCVPFDVTQGKLVLNCEDME